MPANSDNQSCFVISPIGDPERTPERRRQADAVMRWIIQPAVKQVNERGGDTGLRLRRGDEIFRPGAIMRQVVESIAADDILVAVMFEDNVNVFYELGIAETLGRPVILLKKRDYPVPFDIGEQRNVEYPPGELGPGPETDKAVAGLATHMLGLLEHRIRFKSPFWLGLMAPPARTTPHDRFLALEYPDWSEMLLSADREAWLAGTALWKHMIDPNFRMFREPREAGEGFSFDGATRSCNVVKILRALYYSGREVNVLTMDEDSPLLPTMLYVEGGSQADKDAALMEVREAIRATHRVLRATLESLASDHPADPAITPGTFRVTKIRERMLTSRVTMTERRGFVTPIFYTLGINSGPCFQIAPKSRDEMQMQSKRDGFEHICMFNQVRDDLLMHVAENESVAVVNGRLVQRREASRLGG